jgi:putative tryptophan/tyrosine transport system substrate-binding protein
MRRRDLMAMLGGAALALPLRAHAQAAAKVPRIGWVTPGTQAEQAELLDAFRGGLDALGYVAGRTIDVEYLYADGTFDRLPALAAQLVAGKFDILMSYSSPGCLAVKQATATIPIVCAVSSDPIGIGLVPSLAHPGGNLTGLSNMAPDISGKRLELMQSLVPKVSLIAVLWDPSNVGMAQRVRETRAAAERVKIQFYDAGASTPEALEVSFAQLAALRPGALVVTSEAFTTRYRDRILDFMATHHIPAMYEDDRYVKAGGLMSYGPNIPDLFRRAATYVDKILKGAKPGDLPIEQATRFDLTINLKTAKALELTIPPTLLARADAVIE